MKEQVKKAVEAKTQANMKLDQLEHDKKIAERTVDSVKEVT